MKPKPMEFPPQAVFLVTGAMLQLIVKGDTPIVPTLLTDNDGNVWHVATNHKTRLVVLSRRQGAFGQTATATTWHIPVCHPTMMAEEVLSSTAQTVEDQIEAMKEDIEIEGRGLVITVY